MAKLTLKNLLALDEKELKNVITELRYEEGLALLEQLVSEVESGKLALDAAMTSYEKGVFLIEHLRSVLGAAEEKLVQLNPNG